MRRPAAFFPIFLLTIGALVLASAGGARADARGEGPIEITKCQVIDQPGSYVLANNLTGSPVEAACLRITANFVTIDLNGFLISGNTAINALERQGIAVRNGVISSSGNGVVLASGVVEGLRLLGMGDNRGIFVGSGIVKGNFVSQYLVGIDAGGTVTGNFVEHNRGIGIFIVQGSTVIGNTALNNGGLNGGGIVVNCPANVTDNTAVGNGSPVGFGGFGNLRLDGEGCNNTNNVAP
jgi:hypothetical protein